VLTLLAAPALASGTTPEDRVEVFADTGVFTGQLGVSFGVGAGLRRGVAAIRAIAGVGGRDDPLGTGASDRPGFGLGTLAVALDAPTSARGRFGLDAILDAALLDRVEQDCTDQGCRHQFFVPLGLEAGVSAQPALELRVSGVGESGAGFALGLGMQPHTWKNGRVLPTPRMDLAVTLGQDWSVHSWVGRYGGSIGVGRTLSRPR
jgi:hypothetical protein